VNPQVDRPGVSTGAAVGMVVGTGVGVTFPAEGWVQPATQSAAMSSMTLIPETMVWFFMEITSAVIFGAGAIYGFIILRKIWESSRHGDYSECRIGYVGSHISREIPANDGKIRTFPGR
jgi:ABC-type nitrate/sulfonate/bicarbonate transport system permease component